MTFSKHWKVKGNIMSSTGTLSIFNQDKGLYQSVYIHHVETNLQKTADRDTFTALNSLYRDEEIAKKLIL
jgi:hypothetical protein